MMRVSFGTLEDMMNELREKRVEEVRVEALHDRSFTKHGVPFLRVYVNVDALLPDRVPCRYQLVTFDGIRPLNDGETSQQIRRQQQEALENIKQRLTGHGFTVRAGHFED